MGKCNVCSCFWDIVVCPLTAEGEIGSEEDKFVDFAMGLSCPFLGESFIRGSHP